MSFFFGSPWGLIVENVKTSKQQGGEPLGMLTLFSFSSCIALTHFSATVNSFFCHRAPPSAPPLFAHVAACMHAGRNYRFERHNVGCVLLSHRRVLFWFFLFFFSGAHLDVWLRYEVRVGVRAQAALHMWLRCRLFLHPAASPPCRGRVIMEYLPSDVRPRLS